MPQLVAVLEAGTRSIAGVKRIGRIAAMALWTERLPNRKLNVGRAVGTTSYLLGNEPVMGHAADQGSDAVAVGCDSGTWWGVAVKRAGERGKVFDPCDQPVAWH
jgi:hypothetical protein